MRCTAINLDNFGARHQNISRNIFLRPADLSNSCCPASLIKQQSVYCRIRMQYMRPHACTENNTGGVDLNPGRSIALPARVDPAHFSTTHSHTHSHPKCICSALFWSHFRTVGCSLMRGAWWVRGGGWLCVGGLQTLYPTPHPLRPPDHHLMSLLPKTDKTRDLLPQ